MSSNFIRITLYIADMTCVNCENIIEQELSKTPGIQHVKASYSNGTIDITYDESAINVKKMIEILEASHYHIREEGTKSSHGAGRGAIPETSGKGQTMQGGRDYSGAIGTVIIIFALYMIANRMGFFNLFNNFPLAKDGMGYGMLFIIGLLTSIHCVAMCGGICLSQCVPKNSADESKKNKFTALRPSILYNLGRVISYTVVGGIVGALGSVVSFSGAAKGFVQILAGVFMVIMGLNMLNVFPWLRKLSIRMPKIFAKKIYEKRQSNSPLYIGLLNGLMPCGPLQAMQLYALSTGSPIKGALSMFLFSVGTVPLMFAFGALSSFLTQKFTKKMMAVSAVLVVVLGLFMFNNGMSLSGIMLPSITSADSVKKNANTAIVKDDLQEVTSKISSGGYEPIIVQKGIPVKWTLQADEGSINGCNYSITIPEYNIKKDLQAGDNVIEFTPDKAGSYTFSCWMGMIRSKITVVEDLNNIDDSAQKDAAEVPSTGGGGGCCGGGGAPGGSASTGSGIDYDKLKNAVVKADELAIAEVKDGVQYINITYDEKGFSPAVVVMQSGIDTEWIIQGKPSDKDLGNLVFPNYNAKLRVKEGDNPIKFVPQQDFGFFTEDGTYLGYVKVVPDIKKIDKKAILKEALDYNPVNTSF